MTDEIGTFLFDPSTNETIREALPWVVVEALAILTRLGDGAVLVALAMILYWFGAPSDRRDRVMVLAVAVTTLALVAGLKGILAIERPLYVAEFAFAPDEYPGYSTPSAHAMGSAAVYGALAAVMTIGKKWQRWAVAGFLIVTVPLSRVVIGVHYLGDVIAGALLGLMLVGVALKITKNSVTPMFALSLVIAVSAFFLGSEEFTAMSIGASLGGLVVWSQIEGREPDPLGASIVMLGIIVIPALLVFRAIEALVSIGINIEITGVGEVPLMFFISIGAYAFLFGAALAVPLIAERLNDWDSVKRLQKALPFKGRTLDPDEIPESVAD